MIEGLAAFHLAGWASSQAHVQRKLTKAKFREGGGREVSGLKLSRPHVKLKVLKLIGAQECHVLPDGSYSSRNLTTP